MARAISQRRHARACRGHRRPCRRDKTSWPAEPGHDERGCHIGDGATSMQTGGDHRMLRLNGCRRDGSRDGGLCAKRRHRLDQLGRGVLGRGGGCASRLVDYRVARAANDRVAGPLDDDRVAGSDDCNRVIALEDGRTLRTSHATSTSPGFCRRCTNTAACSVKSLWPPSSCRSSR